MYSEQNFIKNLIAAKFTDNNFSKEIDDFYHIIWPLISYYGLSVEGIQKVNGKKEIVLADKAGYPVVLSATIKEDGVPHFSLSREQDRFYISFTPSEDQNEFPYLEFEMGDQYSGDYYISGVVSSPSEGKINFYNEESLKKAAEIRTKFDDSMSLDYMGIAPDINIGLDNIDRARGVLSGTPGYGLWTMAAINVMDNEIEKKKAKGL